MKKITIAFGFYLLFGFSVFSQTQERVPGKVIKDYGASFTVDQPDLKTDLESEFKVIFDVSESSGNPSEMNKNIETAARFLNMHSNAGKPIDQLKVAMTIHGEAWKDVLKNDEYKKRFGVDNPNFQLINQLVEAGADIVICGQSAAKREMTRDDINSNVKIALSATTALIQFQNKGYHFIKF